MDQARHHPGKIEAAIEAILILTQVPVNILFKVERMVCSTDGSLEIADGDVFMETISALLRNLTLEDLREWAGTKIFSRGQSCIRHVKELSRLEDGTLLTN